MNRAMGTLRIWVFVVLAHLWLPVEASTAEEWAHTIEVAGIQRMYTQEMQKEFLLVAANCRPDQNKEKLALSLATYHKNLLDLRNGNAAEKVLAAPNEFVEKDLNILWDMWHPLRALLESNVDTIYDGSGPVTRGGGAVSNLTVLEEMSRLSAPLIRYWNEVTVLLVDAARYDGQATNGLVMDIAERQIMLVHKMGKEMLFIGLEIHAAENLALLLETKDLFVSSHEGIIQGAVWTGIPALRNVCTLNRMREVTYYYDKFQGPVLEVIAARTEAESVTLAADLLKNITALSDPLLKSMKDAAHMFIYEPDTATCLENRTLSDNNWRTVVLAAEDQNFFCAQAAALFMQVALGYAVSASKVELTVLLDTADQSLQDLVEGNRKRDLVAPPVQSIVDRLVSVQKSWRDLDLVLKQSVRSDYIVKTTVSEVARLSENVLTDMSRAVDLYVDSAEISDTAVPVYSLDIAGRQQTYVQKLAKETGLIGYGYSPEYYWAALNESRDTFMSVHWKLLEGAPASGTHAAVPATTDVCIVQQMKRVSDKFGELEEAALAVANGNLEEMTQLVRLNPETVAELSVVVTWYGDQALVSCEPPTLSAKEWEGLINEAGSMRVLSQEAAGDFILSLTGNNSLDLQTAELRIDHSLRRLKYGNRIPSVPAPLTQIIFDDILQLLEPAVKNFEHALQGQDVAKVLETADALLAETEALKKRYLSDASSGELAVVRYDLSSRQTMLVKKMFKQALATIYQVGNIGNETAAVELQNSIGEFEAVHNALKEGGMGMEPVILSREDILDQWEVIDAAWKNLKPLLTTTNPLDVANLQAAVDDLVAEIKIAVPLYAIPDNPIPPEVIWSALAYIGISTFVVGVCCTACCVLYSAHRRRKREAAEMASSDAVIPPMA